MKKAIVLLLAVSLLFGGMGALYAGAAAGKIPTVYIVGGNQVMRDPDTGEQKWNVVIPEGYIGEAVQDCIGDLMKAVATGSDADIDAYKEKLVSWIAPLYEEVRCDENGDPLKQLTVCRDYNVNLPFALGDSIDDRIYNGYYPVRAYDFYYDWRADLFLAAAQLEQYIDMILAATGSVKVNLVGRCEGASLILAYLSRYGAGKLNRMVLYTPTSEEYMLVSQSYAGKIRFSFSEIATWLDNNRYLSLDTLPVGGELLELLEATVRVAAKSPLGLTGAALDRIYDRIFKRILPDVILASYGTMPATWSMVSEADFETAVHFVFGGKEMQYAGLIEKIRTYHDTAGARSEELLNAAQAGGVHIGVITKYGFPAVPLFEESAMLSDGSSLLKYTSFGATTANQYETLPESYIAGRIIAGKAKYISPDKKIDASSCLFPDTTWFVGGIDHDDFPWTIDLMIERFMLEETPMTVDSDAERPQFLFYENGNIVPMTEENAERSVIGDPAVSAPEDSFYRFVRSLADLLIRVIRYFSSIISGIVSHAQGEA